MTAERTVAGERHAGPSLDDRAGRRVRAMMSRWCRRESESPGVPLPRKAIGLRGSGGGSWAGVGRAIGGVMLPPLDQQHRGNEGPESNAQQLQLAERHHAAAG